MQKSSENRLKVLVLGGSNFMGKALIKWLNINAELCDVYIINRGKVYWNNQVRKDHPHLHQYYGDRKEHKDLSKTINYINEKVSICQENPWKCVIDFTSFRWRDLQSSIKALKNKTELYVFISSDSLYNNAHFSGQPIEEDKFNLEQHYRDLKGKKVSDKYGYDKLKCQIYLQRTKYVPYICLRLPDVIGPFDNTQRYWCSLFWILKNNQYSLEMNEKDQKKPLSFVYSEDIAAFIGKLILNNDFVKPYQSYNLAFNENPTFQEFIFTLAKTINHQQQFKIKYIKSGDSSGFYPSTEYTCINTDKAIRQLGWNPSTIVSDAIIKYDAMMTTSNFFMNEAIHYETEKRQMMKEFKRKVINND